VVEAVGVEKAEEVERILAKIEGGEEDTEVGRLEGITGLRAQV